MKKITLIILIIFTFLISFGQELEKDFIKSNGIKSTKLYIHEINKDKIIKSELLESHLFDKKGNLIEEYSKHGLRIIYEYDSNENLIKKVSYRSDSTEYELNTWVYDINGRILKKYTKFGWVNKPYNENYFYNEQGKNIEIFDINEQGEKYRILTKKYYDSGELLEERFEFEKNNTTWIKRYDKCGNLIYKYGGVYGICNPDIKYLDSCIVDSSANILKTDTIRYTEFGKKITKIIELRLSKQVFVAYEQNIKIFDEKGNLIINELYEYGKDSILMSCNISFFNEKGQLIEEKIEFSFSEDSSIVDTKRIKIHSKQYYYDNGLLKSRKYFDEKGKILEYWEMEYYDNGIIKITRHFNENSENDYYKELQFEYY
ncbi:MAG: hypothetical protein H6Q25_35 [Bacteroidetes bacterium]|nr:hypothetical protein [Bacteroidota bacterium]